MISIARINELHDRLDDDLTVMRDKGDLDSMTWAANEEMAIQEALCDLKLARAALEKIANLTQTKDLLWWQIDARVALGLPTEATE